MLPSRGLHWYWRAHPAHKYARVYLRLQPDGALQCAFTVVDKGLTEKCFWLFRLFCWRLYVRTLCYDEYFFHLQNFVFVHCDTSARPHCINQPCFEQEDCCHDTHCLIALDDRERICDGMSFVKAKQMQRPPVASVLPCTISRVPRYVALLTTAL